jgi:ABC-type branched-subunit amino acid transport system permease subunit
VESTLSPSEGERVHDPTLPSCHAAYVVARRRAQTTAAALCGVAGAIQGASAAIFDADRNRFTKGISYPLSVIASAILGGLLGEAAGCAAGAAIGAQIDQALPDNLRCQACGHVF